MEELKICELCGFQTTNGKIMSNHKRWKHIIDRTSTEYKQFLIKVSSARKVKKITKSCICEKCGKLFEQTHSPHEWDTGKNVKRFCSISCSHSRGPRTEDFKNHLHEILSKKEIIERICPICKKIFLTKVEQKYCSVKCAHESRKNFNLSDFNVYRRRCAFTFALNQFPNEFDFKLIEKYGWYAASNSKEPNLNGVSRDHMLSVKYGFEHKIDPKIISHPANCRLLRQNENSKKNCNCSITYEQLLEKIRIWEEKYGKC